MTMCAGAVLGAQQLTTVAVVNIRQVYDDYFSQQSSATTDAIQQRYQGLIDEQRGVLQGLNDARRQAHSEDSRERMAEIDREIARVNTAISQLNQQRNNEVRARRRNRLPDVFLQNLQRSIVFVAESRGYTVVLRADNEGIQWWSSVVDITKEVLARLLERY